MEKHRLKGLWTDYQRIIRSLQGLVVKKGQKHRMDTHERRARTRTLIQLGGLVEKAGLLQAFGLETGDDLQKDADAFESAATLLGVLLEASEVLASPLADAQQSLWHARGKEAFGD
jgi:hypothetical protein